ncbi:type 2 lanthipeptide synthetase LanM family protein [Paenibacillus sp. HJGM_3]|uniref:type 2 lanthipeptide synthetase LanM family protein n=1 Tax=Paenibacillus sp. HJGM_3 TaxID=3379816 RepID=UPI00385B474E
MYKYGNEWLRAIVARSSGLAERLTDRFVPKLEITDNADRAEVSAAVVRLRRWSEAVGKGDAAKFAGRLALSGWTADDAVRAVHPVRLRDAAALPEWADMLRLFAEQLQHRGAVPTVALSETLRQHPLLEPGKPLAFEHALLPFAEAGANYAAEQVGELSHVLSAQAWRDAVRSLLRELVEIACKTLDLEFKLFRIGSFPLPGSTEQYDRFVCRLLEGDWFRLMQEYSVLARLMSTAVLRWADSFQEFLRRYEEDEVWRDGRLRSGITSSRVIERLALGESDRHNGGRTVMIATLEGGGKIVYKPKPLRIDTAYAALLAWLREHGAPGELAAAFTVDRGEYGWQSFVASRPCAIEADAARYYRSAGALVAISWLLGGSDLHRENVIASGVAPIPVDVEAYVQPDPDSNWPPEEVPSDAERQTREAIARSVLRSSLLPEWVKLKSDTGVDISGLFSSLGMDAEQRSVRRFKFVNTDAMKIGDVIDPESRADNDPHTAGCTFDESRDVPALLGGFREMYDFLLAQREALLAAEGPLAAFGGQATRFLFRSTSVYGQLLEKSWHPDVLKDGADRDIRLEAMCRYMASDEEEYDRWPIVERELEALRVMDVPYFRLNAGDVRLSDESGAYGPNLFRRSGRERLHQRVRTMGTEDRPLQISLIRGALYTKFAGAGRRQHPASTAELAADCELVEPGGAIGDAFGSRTQAAVFAATKTESTRLLHAAAAIADRLSRRAITAEDGTRTWIVPGLGSFIPRQRPMPYHLYGGTCGIALLHAALYRSSGDRRAREETLAALRLLRRRLAERDADDDPLARMTIGGFSGLGSIVYTLVRISQMIGEPSLLREATAAAELVTDVKIAADIRLDLMDGAAGALLSLLALHQATGEAEHLRLAKRCGEHLLTSRTKLPAGHEVWQVDGKALAGFSHGAAGIAYALLKLHQAAPDPRLVEAAVEAIRYERDLFDHVRGVWPDLREGAEDGAGLVDAWCNGAAGIGLARLAGLAALDNPDIRREIDLALDIVYPQRRDYDKDCVCCGQMGRAELLLSASLKLGRGDLAGEARRRALRFADKYGRPSSEDDCSLTLYEEPSFFQGIAGIGYELLRFRSPELLPNVLVLE